MKAAILFHHGNETHLWTKYKQMVYPICDSQKLTLILVYAYGTEPDERKWPKLVTSADGQ